MTTPTNRHYFLITPFAGDFHAPSTLIPTTYQPFNLADGADEWPPLAFHFRVVVGARQMENAPALGALQHRAGTVAVVAVPVMVAHSLQIWKHRCDFYL